jgi:hypothetical protein
VNDAAKMRRVANEGVDAIVTDEPGEASRQIHALRDLCPSPERTTSGPSRGETQQVVNETRV